MTPGGARLLAERLAGPLTDAAAIRDAARRGRASWSRTAICATGCARILQALAGSCARALAARPRTRRPARSRLRCATVCSPRATSARCSARRRAAGRAALCRRAALLRARRRPSPTTLAAALADELPLLQRDGGFVRAGYDRRPRRARELQQDSRRFIAALQARYATRDRLPHASHQAQPHDRLLRRGAAECRRGPAEAAVQGRPSSIARRWPARCASRPSNSASSRRRSPPPPTGRSHRARHLFDAMAQASSTLPAAIALAAPTRSPSST